MKNILFNYTDKLLVISPELNNFIKNGFIARDEKRNIKTVNAAYIGITIALILGIYNIVSNTYTNRSSIRIQKEEIKVLNNSFSEINNKLDSLILFKNRQLITPDLNENLLDSDSQ